MIQNITPLDAVPLRSQATDETAYRQGVEAFLSALKQLSGEFGVSIPQFNSTATTINEKEASSVVAATTATTQAGIATTKASAAAASAIASYNAQIGAEAALDAFDDKYLGAKSIFPTVDNDGDPLQMGATFWKSTSPKGFYVYDSELSTWQQYSFIPTSHGSLSGREDVDAHSLSSITGVSAFARTLLDDADVATMKTTMEVSLFLTSLDTTSGTFKEFIPPSWAKEIELVFYGVSLSGSTHLLVQLATELGLEITGYTSISSFAGGANNAGYTSSSAGLVILLGGAGSQFFGSLKIASIGNNKFVSSHCGGGNSSSMSSRLGGGAKTLAAALAKIKVTNTGSDSFITGSIGCIIRG